MTGNTERKPQTLAEKIWGELCMKAIEFDSLSNDEDSSITAGILGVEGCKRITELLDEHEAATAERIRQLETERDAIVVAAHREAAEIDLAILEARRDGAQQIAVHWESGAAEKAEEYIADLTRQIEEARARK